MHQSAGLSRYTTRLAEALLAHERDRVDLRLFYNAHSGDELPPSLRDVPSHSVPMSQIRWRMTAYGSQLTRLNQRRVLGPLAGTPVIYHATEHLLPRLPVPTVLTVHDLIFERYPAHHTWRNVQFLKRAMPAFVAAADVIIAVSEHTKRDLVELYATPQVKIRVVYEGVDAHFAPAPPDAVAAVRARYGLTRPYLLTVGTLEPRKNHLTAMAALARLKAAGQDVTLAVAGGQGWRFEPVQQRVAELALEDDVIFTGYVPDADLPALYTGAACVLVPSLYEGFGFPVLEAMACGAPVICSQASSLPELAGDAAILIHPTDDEALAAHVTRVLTEPDVAASLRARGLTQAARFTWAACARETADVYAELAQGMP